MKTRNALGYVIGGSSEKAELVFGNDASGNRLAISEVESGLGCGLVCPECLSKLVAKKGDIRAHHFAHAAGSMCLDEYGAVETQAHLFAKTVLQRAALQLPSFEYMGEMGQLVELRNAFVEQTRGTIRPDVVCEVKWNSNDVRIPTRWKELAVEIKVKHAVNARKAKMFEAQALACIEIDLSAFRSKSDEEIRDAVLHKAPRRWIWKKPPMPVKRITMPTGSVPKGKVFNSRPVESEFTAKDWRDFDRRHFPENFKD